MDRPLNLFERPTIICYCATGATAGASSCQPCRDRRKDAEAIDARLKAAIAVFKATPKAAPMFIEIWKEPTDGPAVSDKWWEDAFIPTAKRKFSRLGLHTGKTLVNEPHDKCTSVPCNGRVRVYIPWDFSGCSCHLGCAPCSACTEDRLECPECHTVYRNGRRIA
jgi:hypothetical protein